MLRKALAAALLLLASSTALADAALDLALRNYAHNRVLDSRSEITMTLSGKSGKERVRKLSATTKLKAEGGDNMRLLRFHFPADVSGTTTLLIENSGRDDDLWIYLPALKKVRRLVSENKRDSFVGSDLSFGDILGHKPSDWTFKLIGEASLDGVATTQLEALPATPLIARNTGYSKRLLWIAPDSAVSLRVDYYDEAGQLLKTVTASDIQTVDSARHLSQFMRIEASNVQSGQRTVMQFEHFKANVGVTAELFSPLAIALSGDE